MLSNEYIAGFMDGEGTFFLAQRKQKYIVKNGDAKTCYSWSVRVSVTNTFLPVLEQIQNKYGGTLRIVIYAGERKATKNAYELYLRYDEMKVLLPNIIPYLVEKKDRAQAVLDFLESRNKV